MPIQSLETPKAAALTVYSNGNNKLAESSPSSDEYLHYDYPSPTDKEYDPYYPTSTPAAKVPYPYATPPPRPRYRIFPAGSAAGSGKYPRQLDFGRRKNEYEYQAAYSAAGNANRRSDGKGGGSGGCCGKDSGKGGGSGCGGSGLTISDLGMLLAAATAVFTLYTAITGMRMRKRRRKRENPEDAEIFRKRLVSGVAEMMAQGRNP